MRLREYLPPFDNPEGCDFEGRIEHLQPWEDRTARALQHSHAFHMRYYYSALAGSPLEKVTLNTATERHLLSIRRKRSLRGRTQQPEPRRRGSMSDLRPHRRLRHPRGNLVELVHDPLGLELLLSGTIRDKRVQSEDYGQREVGSIAALGDRFRINSLAFFPVCGDRNTLRIGVVVITTGP